MGRRRSSVIRRAVVANARGFRSNRGDNNRDNGNGLLITRPPTLPSWTEVGALQVAPSTQRPERVRTRSISKRKAAEDKEEEAGASAKPKIESKTDTVSSSSLVMDTTPKWAPSAAIGSPLALEGEDLSRIELADRKVHQTRKWLDYYNGGPYFENLLQEAIREREQLDETDVENTKPMSSLNSIHQKTIKDRIDVLRSVLKDSVFPPERENISAAIAGYESGAINPQSSSYTIIWAGRIVDTCPDYDSFTLDREARLDRYAAQHGPGWLWYEAPLPLDEGAGGALRGPPTVVKKAMALDAFNLQSTDNQGHWRILMGFRRRKEAVMRGSGGAGRKKRKTDQQPETPTALGVSPVLEDLDKAQVDPPPSTARSKSKKQPSTEFDPNGPCIMWNTLLDSGATYPCLFSADLPALRIDPTQYAAQSVKKVATAEGIANQMSYELDVTVHTTPNNPSDQRPQHEVMSKAALSPLGTTLPVIVFNGQANSDFTPGATPERLSGILPFHSCYLSAAPGSRRLWLGETRGEVLGIARLPAAQRCGVWKSSQILGGVNSSTHNLRSSGKFLPAGYPSFTSDERAMNPIPRRIIFEHDTPDGSGRVITEIEQDPTGGTGNDSMVTDIVVRGHPTRGPREEYWITPKPPVQPQQEPDSANRSGSKSSGVGTKRKPTTAAGAASPKTPKTPKSAALRTPKTPGRRGSVQRTPTNTPKTPKTPRFPKTPPATFSSPVKKRRKLSSAGVVDADADADADVGDWASGIYDPTLI